MDKNEQLAKAYKLFTEKKYSEIPEYLEGFLKDYDNPKAMYLIGVMCLYGLGYEKNIDAAIHYFSKGSEKGHAFCYYALGKIYEEGNGVERSILTAFNYYSEGAKLGNDKCLEKAENIGNTPELKQEFLKEALKDNLEGAEKGEPGALRSLGAMYLRGEGVEKDEKKGFEYINKAIELGYTPAYKSLGNYYFEQYPPRLKEAAIWYQKCLDNGIDDEIVISRLMFSYRETNDNESTLRIAKIGVEKDYDYCMVQLGYFYSQGKCVPLNNEKAVELFRRAADKGNAGGAFNLGIHYLNGAGVPKDISMAIGWFTKSAEGGDYDAAMQLAKIYGGYDYDRFDPERARKYREMAEKIKSGK